MVRVVTVKLPSAMLALLDEYARRNGITRSDAIREGVRMLLLRNEMIRMRPIKVIRVRVW